MGGVSEGAEREEVGEREGNRDRNRETERVGDRDKESVSDTKSRKQKYTNQQTVCNLFLDTPPPPPPPTTLPSTPTPTPRSPPPGPVPGSVCSQAVWCSAQRPFFWLEEVSHHKRTSLSVSLSASSCAPCSLVRSRPVPLAHW